MNRTDIRCVQASIFESPSRSRRNASCVFGVGLGFNFPSKVGNQTPKARSNAHLGRLLFLSAGLFFELAFHERPQRFHTVFDDKRNGIFNAL